MSSVSGSTSSLASAPMGLQETKAPTRKRAGVHRQAEQTQPAQKKAKTSHHGFGFAEACKTQSKRFKGLFNRSKPSSQPQAAPKKSAQMDGGMWLKTTQAKSAKTAAPTEKKEPAPSTQELVKLKNRADKLADLKRDSRIRDQINGGEMSSMTKEVKALKAEVTDKMLKMSRQLMTAEKNNILTKEIKSFEANDAKKDKSSWALDKGQVAKLDETAKLLKEAKAAFAAMPSDNVAGRQRMLELIQEISEYKDDQAVATLTSGRMPSSGRK